MKRKQIAVLVVLTVASAVPGACGGSDEASRPTTPSGGGQAPGGQDRGAATKSNASAQEALGALRRFTCQAG